MAWVGSIKRIYDQITKPFSTPATKRRKVQESSLLGPKHGESIHLPPSVVNSIFEFCDFATLVNVGSCNTVLQRFVYEEETKTNYWRVLDFGTLEPKWSNQITDKQLDTLLRRINAREKYFSIRLTGCLRIQGSGLESLRGTRTVRDIDLSVVHPDDYEHAGVNLDQVLPILSSMASSPPNEEEADTTDQTPAARSLDLLSAKFHPVHLKGEEYYKKSKDFGVERIPQTNLRDATTKISQIR